ncbi:MAG: cyclopropane fatty acyl phospholipid synthase [Deltaproteobacteria bacterium]|nr:cyclopropane fatty acyl phospholipid synthase [Deltaproteobacteria bacterium]
MSKAEVSSIRTDTKKSRHIFLVEKKVGTLIEEMVRVAGIELGRDMIVHDPAMWADWASRGILAIGESYMAKQWDSPHIDRVMAKLFSMPSEKKRRLFSSWKTKLLLSIYMLCNQQRRTKEIEVAEKHYDLGNGFFQSWLDKNMQYSCGYWNGAMTLDEAQLAKMTMIAQKLKLSPGMTVLDIGCGWGGLGRFLVKKYGVKVTGINISKEQTVWCRDKVIEEGLQDSFESLNLSYRDIKGTWDRIVTVGMIEHVGPKNYHDFFDICKRCLADNGIMLLQTIGSNISKEVLSDRWLTRYIFPGGSLPSIAQIARASEKKLIIEDLQNFGPHYDKTLMAWYDNFSKVKDDLDMSGQFIRMWEFYLLYCAAGFRERKSQLWQFVLTKKSN